MENPQDNLAWLTRTLKHIDLSMRGGAFIYAYREIGNLIAHFERGEVRIDDRQAFDDILKRLRRASHSLRPIVEAAGNVSGAFNVAKRLMEETKNQEENHDGTDGTDETAKS
jgi:hypothetical protein